MLKGLKKFFLLTEKMSLSRLNFYNIKKIEDYCYKNKLHYFIVINMDNTEQFVCLDDEMFIIFWAHYRKYI